MDTKCNPNIDKKDSLEIYIENRDDIKKQKNNRIKYPNIELIIDIQYHNGTYIKKPLDYKRIDQIIKECGRFRVRFIEK